ncbi:hypothetical protein GCM10022251_43780 [Phytohabitans flavus]|uniref:Uncharacterized protein n=1 Tax=Phytohabitans flavus TaxID=1076124 RepID=A0A6F8XYK8_9ACTN|nr:hypothetical protein Pflav_053150 [Phytohabitans flavus]
MTKVNGPPAAFRRNTQNSSSSGDWSVQESCTEVPVTCGGARTAAGTCGGLGAAEAGVPSIAAEAAATATSVDIVRLAC